MEHYEGCKLTSRPCFCIGADKCEDATCPLVAARKAEDTKQRWEDSNAQD